MKVLATKIYFLYQNLLVICFIMIRQNMPNIDFVTSVVTQNEEYINLKLICLELAMTACCQIVFSISVVNPKNDRFFI